MMPFISFLGPLLLTAMGSLSIAVCYQAIAHMLFPAKPKKTRQTFRYVVPKLKQAATLDCVKVEDPNPNSDWPRFSTGGCAVTSDGACSTTGFEDARESTPDPMDTLEPSRPPSPKTRPLLFCPLRV